MEKLRKALDKAKRARLEEASIRPAVPQKPPAPEERRGWVSPVYSQSRAVALDPKIVAKNRCVCINPDAPEMEFYKVLRTQILQRTRAKGWNTVMITSAVPGEGKTTTAINLAITFAKEFSHTVLLVDCDLKKQGIRQVLGLSSELGLADYLLDDRPVRDLIVWPGIEKLTVISGTRTIQDTSELLGSPRMEALVAEMKTRYEDRYVFFDVPAVLGGADAIAFAPLVDAVLMVTRADRTSAHDVRRAVDLLPADKFLGFVLNRKRRG